MVCRTVGGRWKLGPEGRNGRMVEVEVRGGKIVAAAMRRGERPQMVENEEAEVVSMTPDPP